MALKIYLLGQFNIEAGAQVNQPGAAAAEAGQQVL
jgi:hypothetical protein